jgi:hypothetical protein
MPETEHSLVAGLMKILLKTFYQQIQFPSLALQHAEFCIKAVKVASVKSE